MALSDKDILITPNRGQTADPKIEFKGASSTLGPQTISLNVYPTNNGTISFEGSAGQLFSITNDLSGTIYSVNDISGIPSIEVQDTGLVKLAQYSGNVLIGTGTDNGAKLQVNGTVTGTSFNSITGLASVAPLIAGTAAVGTSTLAARQDHVHPVQTTVSGNAGTATTLANARTINGVSFNGGANITVTANTPTSLTFNNGGAGAASGTTFNGGTAHTISYNTVGAAASAHSHTIAWVGGTTAGPTLSVAGGTAVAVPTATASASGIVTTGTQSFAGAKLISNAVQTSGANGYHLELFAPDSGASTGEIALRFHQGSRWYSSIRVRSDGFHFTDGASNTLRAVSAASFNSITGLASVAPLIAGTATVGTSTLAARQDHVHPVQTTVSGNAGTATTLATARTIWGQNFDGSANVTGNMSGISGIAGTTQTIANNYGAYQHIGGWGVARTAVSAVLVNTAYMADILSTARTINGVSFNGSANILVPRLYDANYRRFTNPGGGEYVTTASSVTGAIEIVFPNVFSNGMYKMVVEVYEYTTNESFTVYLAGHTSGTLWYNTSAYIVGVPTLDRRFTIRFGRTAGNKAVVYIGELASTWSYPQVFLTEFQCGYAGYQDNSTGWTIGFQTAAFENVAQTHSNCQVGFSATANTANSVVLRDASGNFSAGTITATLSGNATTATTLATARTINGVSFNGGANITVTANTPTSLTFNNGGAGAASGTTFNGGTAQTISYNTLGAAAAGQTMHIGTTAVAINRASAALTLAGITLTTPNIGAATGTSLLATGEVSGAYLGVENTTSTNGYGISLYGGGSAGQPTYGIMFQGTATFGTHGAVTADWATYFTMNNTANRGWIFKTSTGTAGNVASINVAGTATFAGNVTAFSDIRLKTDLEKIPDALNKVKSLTGYTYTRIDSGERQTGLVAQEVQKVLPEAVLNGDTLALAYGNMVGLLVEAIKEQQEIIETLETRLAKLEEKLK
jgi:hypothetical protein